ncbi:hypothetical protein R3P38DRAFT_3384318 [Favolaschia claudopus]|uniref:Ndc10 domain-containing protein n=1 Tax=Favolaschia claudopus TaxID=2862362 RepID=A0AAW0E4Y6_9AGAR
MDPALLDPSLHSPTEDSVDSPTTNGVSASSLASCQPPAANPSHPPPRLQFSKLQIASWPLSNYAPQRDAGESRAVYEQRLTLVTRKAPLLEACKRLHLKANKSSNLVALRQELANYWFSQASSRHLASSSHNPPSSVNPNDVLNFYPPPDPIHLPPPTGLLPTLSHTTRGEFRGAVPLFHINPAASTASSSRATANPSSGSRSTTLNAARRNTATAAPSQASTNTVSQPASSQTRAPASAILRHACTTNEDEPEDGDDGDDTEELIRQYGVEGANADELLGYDDDDDDDEDGEEEEDGDASDADIADEAAAHAAFKRSVRIQAVNRAEGNRRAGGIKTQNAVKKDFQEWQAMARERGKIKDHIIDEHALLLYINFSAEREKKTRRGVPIPNSRLGASQLKKLFFGVLRIRKVQDAADPMLLQRRPATTFVVWEAIKCRMDEALERVRNGLGENEEEDAPDIRANTFLPEISDEQLKAVGYGFLANRQLRLVIFGHLAWTSQHASGNRGDDFRALKLAELQPYTMPHPDGRTAVPCLLGLQGEEKAGRRGMRTTVNPSYSVFVAHKNPEICAMGAFAFYHHYMHDVLGLTEKLRVDWAWNKSWRQVRVLHGQSSPNTPYSEQALYNLYCRAFQHAGFNSRMRAHLPRHLLGYKQENMNVDSADTAQLGWVRNVTYFDTYKPALPKHAILGAAGFKVNETYDPVWTRVHVPPQFLLLICPDAERIRDEIANRENLSGAFNYWQMIIDMRPYAFQSGAALFQSCPKSALFRLPAFQDEDVRNWMKTTFPEELTLLHAQAGDPADLLLVQNNVLRKALEDLFKICTSSDTKLVRLTALLERRTSALSPAQGFSTTAYHRNALAFSSSPSTPPRGSSRATHSSPITIHFDSEMHETGTYESTGDDGSANHRAFVNTSPRSSDNLRVPTEVDLVLPPTEAFYKPGAPRGVVFALVQQPKFCWDVWGPKSVDRYRDVNEIWTSWIDGEAVSNAAGTQTGKKPPLKYARTANAQHWSRYREIPEWIERESSRRGVSPSTIVDELEGTRVVGNITKGINWLRKEVEGLRKAAKTASNPVDAATSSTAPGEAEAQLAWLNQQEELALVYSMDSIEHTTTVGLDQAGLLLCALLLGGDYAPGVTGIGPATARALAQQGFGRDLVRIMNLSVGSQRLKNLAVWRTALRGELRTNSSGRLAKRLPDAADNISDAFPNLDVVNLYLHPFICTSLEYSGPMPDCSSWRPRDPAIPLIADFCSSTFRWQGEFLLKKLNSNVFPGITFRMISSPLVLYDKVNDLFASPGTGGAVVTIRDAAPGYAQNADLAPLDVKRVRITAAGYIILAVAMRDTALAETNLTRIPGGVAEYDQSIELEVLDSDEEELVSAHSKLASQGVIDLTGDDFSL